MSECQHIRIPHTHVSGDCYLDRTGYPHIVSLNTKKGKQKTPILNFTKVGDEGRICWKSTANILSSSADNKLSGVML